MQDFDAAIREIAKEKIKSYRKMHRLTQTDASFALHTTRPYISLMENCSSIVNIQTILNTIKMIDPTFIDDKDTIDRYLKLFDDYFIELLKEEGKDTKIWDKIESERVLILSSYLKFELPVYEMIHDYYRAGHIKSECIEMLSKNRYLLSDRSRQLLENYAGNHFFILDDIDSAVRHYEMCIALNDSTIVSALARSNLARIFAHTNHFIKALDHLEVAKRIYTRYDLQALLDDNRLAYATVILNIRDYQEAIKLFKDFIDDENVDDSLKVIAKNNLLLSYIRSGDINSAYSFIKNEKLKDVVYINLILHFAFIQNDKGLFDKWYTVICEDHRFNSPYDKDIIDIEKNIFEKDSLEELLYRIDDLLERCSSSEYKDERNTIIFIKGRLHQMLSNENVQEMSNIEIQHFENII